MEAPDIAYTQHFAALEADRIAGAVIHVSPPRADGTASLGLAADAAPAVLGRPDTVLVALVNEAMPDHPGAPRLDLARCAAVVRADRALAEPVPEAPDPSLAGLVDAVAGLVEDGDTLQFGIGRLPGQILAALAGRRRLRVHSGMYADALVDLLQAGAIDPGPDALLAGVAIGSRRLYAALGAEPRARFRPVPETHGLQGLARVPRFTAINGALSVDFFGRINATHAGPRRVSGPGGLPDFAAGAAASRGGRLIVALPSTASAGRISRIVAALPPAAVTLETDTLPLVVVTEHGVANLTGLNQARRTAALTAIAHPDHREALARDGALTQGAP